MEDEENTELSFFTHNSGSNITEKDTHPLTVDKMTREQGGEVK